jgi:lipopolysaccharide biosynthesis glycosyltransferase
MTHIVLTTDEHYAPFVPALLAQIARHGQAAEGVIIVVSAEFPDQAADLLRRTADRVGQAVEIRVAAEPPVPGGFAALGGTEYRTSFTNARLHLGETLSEIDRVLYLDIDLLVRGSLEPLLTWELTHPVAAVAEDTRQALKLFGDARVPYYNSGVMLVSLDRWRAEDIGRVGTELLLAHPEWSHQDQDVINTLFRGRIDPLPTRFNVFDGRRLPPDEETAAIVHFVGNNKPWFTSATSTAARQWRVAQESADPQWEPASGSGRSASWEGRFADGLYAVRHSAAGRAARRVLPDSLKHRVNSLVLSAGRRSRRFRRSIASGLSSR